MIYNLKKYILLLVFFSFSTNSETLYQYENEYSGKVTVFTAKGKEYNNLICGLGTRNVENKKNFLVMATNNFLSLTIHNHLDIDRVIILESMNEEIELSKENGWEIEINLEGNSTQIYKNIISGEEVNGSMYLLEKIRFEDLIFYKGLVQYSIHDPVITTKSLHAFRSCLESVISKNYNIFEDL